MSRREEVIHVFVFPNIREIERRRTELGLGKKALSKKARLPCNAILRIENGSTQRINHLRAEAIAIALGCKIEDICEVPAGKTR